jgi:hypothetical protein
LLESINFNSFFIDERRDERMLTLCMRLFTFCRARFLAWSELAKSFPRIFGVWIMDAGISSILAPKSSLRRQCVADS